MTLTRLFHVWARTGPNVSGYRGMVVCRTYRLGLALSNTELVLH